ncbi:hypothetical protein ACIG3E_32595 [Streptomyces sp. NPDC053474]|uniref:hypothetical protein n=1 Tax=Streptomyces sp. NPDC053474 TaxID=3365704 RepID=UPI0037D13316
MTARLIRTGPIVYTVPGQRAVRRHCRTWALADGSTLSVVTELPGDTGMSITNAAETVRAVLEADWGRGCRIVEHYPWPGDEHYDEQARTPAGAIRWTRLEAGRLQAELGPSLEAPRTAAEDKDAGSDSAPCFGCGSSSATSCRICNRPLCRDCSTDHHHEGYGTPAASDW